MFSCLPLPWLCLDWQWALSTPLLTYNWWPSIRETLLFFYRWKSFNSIFFFFFFWEHCKLRTLTHFSVAIYLLFCRLFIFSLGSEPSWAHWLQILSSQRVAVGMSPRLKASSYIISNTCWEIAHSQTTTWVKARTMREGKRTPMSTTRSGSWRWSM